MKKIKNIVLVVSLLLNVVLFIYATTQNLAAQRNLKEAQRQQEIALEAREAADEQRKMAEQNAMRAHQAVEKAEAMRRAIEKKLIESKK